MDRRTFLAWLASLFSLLNLPGLFDAAAKASLPIPGKTPLPPANRLAAIFEMSTAEIGLSVRTTNRLEERGIFTVHDLLTRTRNDLLSISGINQKTLEDIFKALEGVGLYRPSRRPKNDPDE